MPKSETDMNAKQRIEWFNVRDPLHKWTVGQDVYCLHCEAVFKAEDVGTAADGLPECPLCDATPLDFFPLPFWREDLTVEAKGGSGYEWRGEPIRAKSGQPANLPPELWNQRN